MNEIKRDYYKVLLVSQSGKGKSYSMRNMNPNTTGFINVEKKPLPFKNTFKYHYTPNTYLDVFNTLVEYGKNPEIDCIVIDSISAYFDMVLAVSKTNYKGYDVWNNYNSEIAKLIDMIKRVPKEVFVTAHYEMLNVEGSPEKRVKVKGKELEGVIEKDFTIVLYGDMKTIDDKRDYHFHLSLDGASAKCPPDIFGDEVQKIPNDSKFILDKILKFTKN